MTKIKIIKKNDEYTQEYDIDDIFETTGTWYGGVHITGKTGIPVSLDKDEYVELDAEKTSPEKNADAVVEEAETASEKSAEARVANDVMATERDICVGDIVRHFKREWVVEGTSEYIYKILAFAEHTETKEKLVVYQAMYAPFKICARPYDMFMSEVDRVKYPDVKQKYRFEKVEM